MSMITSHTAFQFAAVLYALALAAALASGKRSLPINLPLAAAIGCNLLAVGLRCHQAWPMLPMHLGPVALPLCLGLFYPLAARNCEPCLRRPTQRILLAVIVLLTALALCFPKDFYLPFLKSKTLLAHGFLWFGVVGKACFILSAVWAANALLPCQPSHAISAMGRSHRWAALGFSLWTASMFSGELWSYLGWGTPVVWEDPALTLTMAAWFFYGCLLHLHLTRSWSQTHRALYASLGGLVMLTLTCLPDLGPFRIPFGL